MSFFTKRSFDTANYTNILKPKRKECAILESKTVKIQILRTENKGKLERGKIAGNEVEFDQSISKLNQMYISNF
jgi:hypothetical protein